jgi:hypothetical protein
VFQHQDNIGHWWLTWGLGSLWWPGFLVMTALIAALTGRLHTFKSQWKPRVVDSDRINRGALAFGLFGFGFGVAMLAALPGLVAQLPGVMPQVFALDPEFLISRAPWVLPLWMGNFVLLTVVLIKGRWNPRLRHVGIAFNVAFIALLGWWLAAGPIFIAKATNDGARGAIALVVAFIAADLVMQLYRQRVRLRSA